MRYVSRALQGGEGGDAGDAERDHADLERDVSRTRRCHGGEQRREHRGRRRPYAISMHNIPLAIAIALLSWGIIYQGYNAIFPCFYPELFQTRTRVSAMAISQNLEIRAHSGHAEFS
jgi:hypothetical protein